MELKEALNHPLWLNHKIGDLYQMQGNSAKWKIAYYPIFESHKGEKYSEPRALVETPMMRDGKEGIDFREMPLRYLRKTQTK